MARPTPGIESRAWHKILRRRGFTEVRGSGGHIIVQAPDGARFPITGDRSKTKPTFGEITTIAKHLGCTVDELLYSKAKR